jgi:hypothetical protein
MRKLTLGEYAGLYAYAGGWHVFPLREQGKTPFLARGLYRATTDQTEIIRWWARWPLANIGLNCGASGLIVPDFDVPKPEFEGARLLAELRQDHPTTTAKTASGGVHLFYRQPEGLKLGNGSGKLPHGVDIRGHGGYVLLAPSVVVYRGDDAAKRNLPDGYTGRYTWLNDLKPAPLPAMLLDLLKPEPPKYTETKAAYRQSVDSFVNARLDAERMAVRCAANGSRNERLNLAAWRLGKLVKAGKLTESEVERALLPEAQACGLGEREALKTIASGLRGAANG